MTYDVLSLDDSVPLIVICPADTTAEVITGKFWRLFGPASASPASFGVTPSSARSIPSLTLEKIELRRMAFRSFTVPAWGTGMVTPTPDLPLNAITFPAPRAVPPTMLARLLLLALGSV